AQALRQHVRLVAELADGGHDDLPHLRADVGVPGEHARDGRHRDPGPIGDLAHPRSARGARSEVRLGVHLEQRYRDRLRPSMRGKVDTGRSSWIPYRKPFQETFVTIPTESETTATPALDGAALTIESIEVTPIVVPLEQEYRGSYYGMRNRSTVLTRVTTRQGVVGEAYAGDEDATLRDIAAVVTNDLAPRLIGENGFSIERCWELGFPVTFDQLRDRRIGLVALASVDLALWDAIGKVLDRPLWQLWGGYRDTIGVNIIGGYYGRDLAGIRDEVTEWRELGFRGCKFKVGGKDPAED